MASTFSNLLRLEKMAKGDQNGTWGTTLNNQLEMIEDAVAGYVAVTHDDTANPALTTANGTTDEARNAVLRINGTLTAARNLVIPTNSKTYLVHNATTGGFGVTLKTAAGAGVLIPNGRRMHVYCDGTDCFEVGTDFNNLTAKATPVDADAIPIVDSAASNGLKKVLFSALRAWLSSTSVAAFITGKSAQSLTALEKGQARANIDADLLGAGRSPIINGDFNHWQRATSQTTNGYGSSDRFAHGHNGSSKTTSRQEFTLGQTDVPGNPRYYCRTVVVSAANAANYTAMAQPIEDVRTFSGRDVTVTFWAKADAVKNIAIEFYQTFGTGGSPSASVTGIGSQLVALTTAWQKISRVVSIPSIAGKTRGTTDNSQLTLNFWLEAGSNFNVRSANLGQQSGTFDIAHISVVEGDATAETDPFPRRTIPQELALCQRYCEVFDFDASAFLLYTRASNVHIAEAYSELFFAVQKRAIPTVTGAVFNSVTGSNIVARVSSARFGGTATGNTSITGIVVVDAEL